MFPRSSCQRPGKRHGNVEYFPNMCKNESDELSHLLTFFPLVPSFTEPSLCRACFQLDTVIGYCYVSKLDCRFFSETKDQDATVLTTSTLCRCRHSHDFFPPAGTVAHVCRPAPRYLLETGILYGEDLDRFFSVWYFMCKLGAWVRVGSDGRFTMKNSLYHLHPDDVNSCKQLHLACTRFSCTVVLQPSCHWLHSLTSHITRGSRITEHIVSVFPETFKFHHGMSYVTPHLMTLSTGTHLFWTLPSPSTNPAEIYGHSWVALWLSHDFLQVVIPSSKLKTRITSTSPKTKCSTNTRIYV